MKQRKKVEKGGSARKVKKNNNYKVCLGDRANVGQKDRNNGSNEEQLRTQENRLSLRSGRAGTPRFRGTVKLEDINLSPFSSEYGHSISPRFRNTLSSYTSQKAIKKSRTKSPIALSTIRGIDSIKKYTRPRDKGVPLRGNSKDEAHQAAYENLLIKRISDKQITYRSHYSYPLVKVPRLNLRHREPVLSKGYLVRTMRGKIVYKYRKIFPDLQAHYLRIFTCIVIIQRLWRQRKVKEFISEFITPRSHGQVQGVWSNRETVGSKLDVTSITQEQTEELIRKYQEKKEVFMDNVVTSEERKEGRDTSPIRMAFEKELHSTEIVTESPTRLDLRGLELSEEIVPDQYKHAEMVRFVYCYRNVALKKKSKSKQTKRSVFSDAESLSEKCLMQKFYSKVFRPLPSSMANFDLFSARNQYRSRELIGNLRSPQKKPIVYLYKQLSVYAEAGYHLYLILTPYSMTSSPLVLLTEPPTYVSTSVQADICTLQGIHKQAYELIQLLVDYFAQYFTMFTKTCFKKEKKKRLPGLTISEGSIGEYLRGIVSYLLKKHGSAVIKSFQQMNPLNLLKIYHSYDEDEYWSEDELNQPIIPNTVFYEYQCYYESTVFKVSSEHKKYCNFLEGLIKIHNLSLANCLSEELERLRVDKLWHPWDHEFQPRTRKTIVLGVLEQYIGKIIEHVQKNSVQGIGQLYRRNYSKYYKKYLDSLREYYSLEGNDWQGKDERLELRMELSEYIYQYLLEYLNRYLCFPDR